PLLVRFFGFAVMLLNQLEVSHLNVADRTLRCDIDGSPDILFGFVKLFAIDKGDTPQGVTVGRSRLKIDDLAGGSFQRSHVIFAQSHRGEGALRVGKVGT